MTNLSFALDSMTRDIRTGSDYYCHNSSSLPTSGNASFDCSDGRNAFSFNEGSGSLTSGCSGERIAYRLNVGAGGVIERRLCNGSWNRATSDEVRITTLDFVVSGTARGDAYNPLVTIYIEGTVNGIRSTGADFEIQTTVAQQLLDI